jgi:hypothetical protein
MTIRTPIESPRRVDKKYVVFKNICSDTWSKKTKNRVKTGIFLQL